MLNRIIILKVVLNIIKYFFEPIHNFVSNSNRSILNLIEEINSQEFVFFTKDDDLATLNKVMLYIKKNEHTKKMKIVTVLDKGEKPSPQLISDIEVLNREYPSIKIDFIPLEGKFGPDLINRLSKKWKIPVNFMFIGSPGDRFPYKVEQFGEVRLII